MIRHELVERLAAHVTFVPVCPEMEIGLGCPRDPIRVVEKGGQRRLVQPSTGRDVTRRTTGFARRFLDGLGRVDGFILKARSPSCGIRDVRIFAGPRHVRPKRLGIGLFAFEVILRFSDKAMEDEAGLADPAARTVFLARLFRRRRLPAELADLGDSGKGRNG